MEVIAASAAVVALGAAAITLATAALAAANRGVIVILVMALVLALIRTLALVAQVCTTHFPCVLARAMHFAILLV